MDQSITIPQPNTTNAEMTTYMLQNFRMELMRFNIQRKKINNYIAIVSLSDINTGRQTWKFPTMKMIDSSAAIASNMMFIGSRDGLLYVFGSETTPPYIG